MDDSARWRVSDNVVFSEFDGGMALLDTHSNTYYALDGIGPFLWPKLIAGSTFALLCAATTEMFDIDDVTVRRDVKQWLDAMMDADLIATDHD